MLQLFLLFLQAMAAVLKTNAVIKRLNLAVCNIGDAGVEAWWVLAVGPVFASSCGDVALCWGMR